MKAALFTKARKWEQSKHPSVVNGLAKGGVCTQWDVIQP